MPALRHEFHDLFCAQIFLRFYLFTLLLTKEYVGWQWLTWLLFIFQHFGFFFFKVNCKELLILLFPLLTFLRILKWLDGSFFVTLNYLIVTLCLTILVNFCLDLWLIVHYLESDKIKILYYNFWVKLHTNIITRVKKLTKIS